MRSATPVTPEEAGEDAGQDDGATTSEQHQPRQAAESLRRAWADRWRRPVVIAVASFAVFRILTQVVALTAAYGIKWPNVVQNHFVRSTTQIWNRWDGAWFLAIAQHGYSSVHLVTPHGVQDGAAFAPLYPGIVHVTSAVLGISALSTSLLLSSAFLVVALVGLYRLVQVDHGVPVADSTLVLLLVFPTAFFLVAPYPESLVLAAMVWSYLAARSQHWLVAGLIAAVAVMAKFYAAVLLLALLVEVYESRTSSRGRTALSAASVIGPSVLAVGGWMAYLQSAYGDPLKFVHAQAGWGRQLGAPWTLVYHVVGDIVSLRVLDTSKASLAELFDFVSLILLVVLAVYTYRRVRRSYGVMLGAGFLIYVCETALIGTTREVLVLFPLFVGMGLVCAKHRWVERLAVVAFLPCLVLLLTRFVQMRFAG
jgi:hypothetical protein